MDEWEVGMPCIVHCYNGSRVYRGTVEKVGRKLVTVRTGPNTTYRFDPNESRATREDTNTSVHTVAEWELRKEQDAVGQLAYNLPNAVRRCDDIEKLQALKEAIERFTGSAS